MVNIFIFIFNLDEDDEFGYECDYLLVFDGLYEFVWY